jgi:N-acetylglucosamine-6-phosphate deacetylase
VTVELIADGVHLHPAVVRTVIEATGANRAALVTDATAAAGLGDGEFQLGAMQIDVVKQVAHVRGTSTIAGSTATMDQLFRAVVGQLGASDAALITAVQVTSTTPARALRLPGIGVLQASYAADLVVLDRDLQPIAVMMGGDWLVEAP